MKGMLKRRKTKKIIGIETGKNNRPGAISPGLLH
jgi:hypothetical protein